MKTILPLTLRQMFSDVVTLGSFSPYTFNIFLAADGTESLRDLSKSNQITLNHEFGHLLHYLTSYIGLKDLSFWAKTLYVLHYPPDASSPEKQITLQADAIIDIARTKQILSIDDEYYYEISWEKLEKAKANKNIWHFGTITGSLFNIDGTLSNRRFWATRFYIGDISLNDSFARVPVGIRTVLEHVAKGIDFVHEMNTFGPISTLSKFSDEAYEPEMLHYYCLAHLVGPMMEEKYGKSAIGDAFFIAGIMVLLLSELPYDVADIWEKIITYAKDYQPEIVPYMSFPHPSFAFPIILKAAYRSDLNLGISTPNDIQNIMEGILKELDLPAFSDIKSYTTKLNKSVLSHFPKNKYTQQLDSLLSWASQYIEEHGWLKCLLNPSIGFNASSPVPIIFRDNTCFNGDIVSLEAVDYLYRCIKRQDEMLRFPFTRNII